MIFSVRMPLTILCKFNLSMIFSCSQKIQSMIPSKNFNLVDHYNQRLQQLVRYGLLIICFLLFIYHMCISILRRTLKILYTV